MDEDADVAALLNGIQRGAVVITPPPPARSSTGSKGSAKASAKAMAKAPPPGKTTPKAKGAAKATSKASAKAKAASKAKAKAKAGATPLVKATSSGTKRKLIDDAGNKDDEGKFEAQQDPSDQEPEDHDPDEDDDEKNEEEGEEEQNEDDQLDAAGDADHCADTLPSDDAIPNGQATPFDDGNADALDSYTDGQIPRTPQRATAYPRGSPVVSMGMLATMFGVKSPLVRRVLM